MALVNESLGNTYYALRHGHSKPNERKMIVSSLSEGTKPEHGLTDVGRSQVRASISDLLENIDLFDEQRDIVVVTSPFSRTMDTTEVIHEAMPGKAVFVQASELRERFFGDLDMQSNEFYENVWDIDARNPSHTRYDVESVLSVLERSEQIIRVMENIYQDALVILSGHGDPLQILETSFRGMDPSQHRELPPLENAELRLLNL